MNRITKCIFLTLTLFSIIAFSQAQEKDTISILLMGDSTTAGGRKILEQDIKGLLMSHENMPEVEVINIAKGGDTAYEFIHSGRYAKETKDLKDIDYIFFRYGINDFIPGKAHRKNRPFDQFFKVEVQEAVKLIKKDFPEAKITLMNILPWRGEDIDGMTNGIVEAVAMEEDVAFMDIYTPYKEMEEKLGDNTLRVRFIALDEIPKQYHNILKPFTKYIPWKEKDMVRVETKEFDAVFHEIPNWYKDKHPNNAGYRLIAREMAYYLLKIIRP